MLAVALVPKLLFLAGLTAPEVHPGQGLSEAIAGLGEPDHRVARPGDTCGGYSFLIPEEGFGWQPAAKLPPLPLEGEALFFETGMSTGVLVYFDAHGVAVQVRAGKLRMDRPCRT